MTARNMERLFQSVKNHGCGYLRMQCAVVWLNIWAVSQPVA